MFAGFVIIWLVLLAKVRAGGDNGPPFITDVASAFVKLAENSKRDPSPHPLIEYWRYSHPPIAKRIPFALGYKPQQK